MVGLPMNVTPEDDHVDAPDAGQPRYAYKPNLVGSPWMFWLTDDGLAWEYGRRSGMVPYREISRVRLCYRPATMQMHRFLTEIWSPRGPKLQISSTSFRGLMEQARQDADYRDFVTELHKRLAAASATARFDHGMHPALYWLGVAVFAALGAGLAILLGRTAWSADWTGVAVLIGVVAIFAWQVGSMLYRNRPGTFRPDALPSIVLPKG